MIRLVGAELLKLRTTWGIWLYLAALAGIVVLSVVATLASRPDDIVWTRRESLDLLEGAGVASLVAALLGIVGFTTEFRHGTAPQTFLLTPVRARVLAAKAVAFALVGALLALLGLGLALAVGVPWAESRGFEVELWHAEAGKLVLGIVLAAALWGILGVALGATIRSQVAAIVGVLVWILIVENLLRIPFPDASAYLPGVVTEPLQRQPYPDDELGRRAAALVFAGWTAAALAVAGVTLRRRDV